MTPRTSTGSSSLYYCTPSLYFSADLTREILEDGWQYEPETEGYCPSNEPQLVDGEPQGAQDVFMRQTAGGPYWLVNVTPPDVAPANAYFQGASSDFSRIFFEEDARLTPNAPSAENLYVWTGGTVHLVTVLPGGTPVQGKIAYASLPFAAGRYIEGAGPYLHAVSADGTRVFFEAEGNIYVRINPEAESEAPGTPTDAEECGADACTMQLDASQAGGSGGGGSFLAAAANGSKAFFTDSAERKVTSTTQEGSGANLYEYDLQNGTLTDLTATARADVLGVVGVGGNGAYLYFVAEGKLKEGASEGQPNLYVAHEGSLAFIATLSGEDSLDWEEGRGASVSGSGEYLAFDSVVELTGYHNTDAVSGKIDTEVFLYGVAAGLKCVSCNPSGAQPVGPSRLIWSHRLLNETGPGDFQRNVLDDGRMFFDSADALVKRDINHRYDVYEWSKNASRLISSGTGDENSYFAEASQSGDDVFFVTGQGLVGADTDKQLSLYDARVAGGFPEPAAVSPPCSDGGCHAVQPQEPVLAAPPSVAFSGPGNLPAHARVNKGKRRGRSHAQARTRKLRRALRRCMRRFAHERHQERHCKQRARRRYGAKARRHHSRGGRK